MIFVGRFFRWFFRVPRKRIFNDSPGPTAHGMQTQLRSMPSATP